MNDNSKSTRRGKRKAKPAETNTKTRFTFLVVLTLGASLLTGCAGILPIPSFSNKVEAGRKLERREVRFIVSGTTTRRELKQRLGSGSRVCSRVPAVAYSWETPGWTMFWWVGHPEVGAYADTFPVGGWHALFVTFDDQGVVLQKDFVSLALRKSLDEQLERWARRVREKDKTRTRAAR